MYSGFVFLLLTMRATVLVEVHAGPADSERQLEQSKVTVDLLGKSVSLNDPFALAEVCKSKLFTLRFPTESCNLDVYPVAGTDSYADPQLLREASLIGLQRISL